MDRISNIRSIKVDILYQNPTSITTRTFHSTSDLDFTFWAPLHKRTINGNFAFSGNYHSNNTS